MILLRVVQLIREIKQRKEEEDMRAIAATTLVSGLGVVGFIAGSMGLSIVSVPLGLGMVLLGGLLRRSE